MFSGTLPKLNAQLPLGVPVLASALQCFPTDGGRRSSNLTGDKKGTRSLVPFLSSVLHGLHHQSGRNEDVQFTRCVYMRPTDSFLWRLIELHL